MEVLSSRVLLRPQDLGTTTAFYRDVLGLAVAREFGAEGRVLGTVFFLGPTLLEVSGRADSAAGPSVQLWLQVRDARATVARLAERGVPVLAEPRLEPWGLVEGWLSDPDGVRLCVVEIPEDHPLRRRV